MTAKLGCSTRNPSASPSAVIIAAGTSPPQAARAARAARGACVTDRCTVAQTSACWHGGASSPSFGWVRAGRLGDGSAYRTERPCGPGACQHAACIGSRSRGQAGRMGGLEPRAQGPRAAPGMDLGRWPHYSFLSHFSCHLSPRIAPRLC